MNTFKINNYNCRHYMHASSTKCMGRWHPPLHCVLIPAYTKQFKRKRFNVYLPQEEIYIMSQPLLAPPKCPCTPKGAISVILYIDLMNTCIM